MNTHAHRLSHHNFTTKLLFPAILVAALLGGGGGDDSRAASSARQSAARSPSEVVREFYRAMRERRFREAFALSIYQPAVEGLSAEEFEELRPDFEKIAATAPEKIEVTGEQISGPIATVFVRMIEDEKEQVRPHPLLKVGDRWLFGDEASRKIVKEQGKKFFLEARINTHHTEVSAMLSRIATAQLIYAAQHKGQFADLAGLVRAGFIPPDLLTTDSTGYRIHVTPAKDGKTYTAGAEPARYNRTGRLSFFMDHTGIKSKDTGGKPLTASAAAKQ